MQKLRTLVHSDRRSGVRLIAEDMNMNRETVQQNIGEVKNFLKMVS
jgi:hypothetical protein